MAKLDSGNVVFNRVDTTTNELVEAALQPLRILLDIKGQQINHIGNVAVICDKNWITEALTNVIKNASEHSPANSMIQIESGKNPLTCWISITDAGQGIPPLQMKGLFKRFGAAGQGTGIGLPLALAIMRGQNGDVEVDGGGNGRGATFTLKFY